LQNPSASQATKVVVATTVMLSFISFWRAAAIVLCDLASSAFYAGGISETAVGKSAPWFILGIMLFSFAVRALYIEGSSMFVRGGVYRVVHEALGGTMAKISVSALLFDFVLTGPISGVSAGLYLAGMLNELLELVHYPEFRVNPRYFAAGFAVLTVLYFWRKNIIGVHESSQKALRIMQLTTVMVVILIVWCIITVIVNGYNPVPFPTLETIKFSDASLGWLKGTMLPAVTWIAILVGLGHSLLAMSGFETLAQVNREIASPKLKNLQRAGMIVVVYSLVFTSMVSFFAVMLIPDKERTTLYIENLIGGLAMYMVGPLTLRLLFHGFVVVVGTVILAGAVNTAILGSNGVLNRVAEDGVLPDWFRHPHKKFGTTHRLINLIVILQLVAIILTRGEIFLLGEAYAFGVVWSFFLNAVSVLVLRFKQPGAREWRVPMNLKIGKLDIPIGLGLITLALFSLACLNLFTKKHATIAGTFFTLAFFVMFQLSEYYHKKRTQGAGAADEKFRLEVPQILDDNALSVRPGNILVSVRNPNQLDHVRKVLEKTDTRKIDILVLTVKRVTESGADSELTPTQVFSNDVSTLFTRVVSLAEKAGKHVDLMVAPGVDPNLAIVETAARLKSSVIVMGLSPRLTPTEQAKAFGDAWEKLPQPRPQLSLEIVQRESGRSIYFNLGPHPPRLWPQDVALLHELWRRLTERSEGKKVHHRDVVRVALRRLEADLSSERGNDVVAQVLEESRIDPSTEQAKLPPVQ
jgi:amino acid transporter